MTDCAGGYAGYGLTAEYYDHLIPYRARGDIAFWVEAAQAAGGPVLEVGCGTGLRPSTCWPAAALRSRRSTPTTTAALTARSTPTS